VLALAFDLTDEKEAVAARLAQMIRENGNRLKTGFVGTPHLLYALSENGYADAAYDLLLQEAYPSWLYEVNHGATTIWEHWDGMKEDGSFWSTDMNSFNHYAYGAVADWLYSAAGGIRPDEEAPGFARAVIAPIPSPRIQSLEAEYKSVHGTIRSKWTNTRDGVRYEIATPVPAEIIIDGKRHSVTPGSYIFYSEAAKG
jgi:alpha-L-rhamnosidase